MRLRVLGCILLHRAVGFAMLAMHEGHLSRRVAPSAIDCGCWQDEPQSLGPEIDPFLIVCRRRNTVLARALDSRCALEAIVVTDRRLPAAYR